MAEQTPQIRYVSTQSLTIPSHQLILPDQNPLRGWFQFHFHPSLRWLYLVGAAARHIALRGAIMQFSVIYEPAKTNNVSQRSFVRDNCDSQISEIDNEWNFPNANKFRSCLHAWSFGKLHPCRCHFTGTVRYHLFMFLTLYVSIKPLRLFCSLILVGFSWFYDNYLFVGLRVHSFFLWRVLSFYWFSIFKVD